MTQLNFISGEKTPLPFQEGISVFLLQKDSINIVIKTNDLTKEQIKYFCKGDVTLGIQRYPEKITKKDYGDITFSLSIDKFLELGIVFCNLNLCVKGFDLTEPIEKDKGYCFNFVLVNEDDIVVITRQIGVTQQFSRVIYNLYNEQRKKTKEVKYSLEQISESQLRIKSYLNLHKNINTLKKFTIAVYKKH